MKLFLRFSFIVFSFIAFGQRSMAQGTIDLSYTNKSVNGNVWTFDVYASAEADYVGPDNNAWTTMNARLDIAAPVGVTYISGTASGNSAVLSTATINNTPPGTGVGTVKVGIVLTRTVQTDLTSTPVYMGTFTITFSGPVDATNLVTPRTTFGATGSFWTNNSPNPTTGQKRQFNQTPPFVLPVSFTSFTGIGSGFCAANLAWVTATEQNSKTYAVEFGTDGKVFTTVGTVASKNSALGNSYTFSYDNLGSATGFFRIKAVDFDGTFIYSPTVSVTGNGGCSVGMLIKVSPNPTTNLVNIQGLVTGSHVSLIDAGGKTLSEVVASGTNQAIYLSTYASGVYTLKIQKADGSITNVKVVKQ